MHKIYFFLLIFLCGFVSQAQVQDAVQDTIKKGYDVGEIQMANPQSILSAYTYDPVTNTYVYTNSVDDFNINYPIVLTPAEYEKLRLKESMSQYFNQKSDAIDGNKKGSDATKKDLLPRYYIKSGLFESIFGSNTIDVKPTGSVEVDLGLLYTKQDNPAFSPRNRTNTSFDFNQRISMSLLGKVGTRLQVNANFDTQSTFAFQNLLKLEYTPADDDIVRKIEVGNVSMPLNSTLIQGAQSLFGVKTELQFGKTTVTGVFSEQKSQAKSVTAQGGGTIQEFEMYGLDYDNDRHFFLSQYFRDKYDASLKSYPLISSRVQITRLEVWVTNKQNRVNTTSNNLRNIIALQDLGEAQLTGLPDNKVVVLNPSTGMFVKPLGSPTDNKNNLYDPALIKTNSGYLTNDIREIVTASSGFSPSIDVSEGRDYSKLENARKLLPNEYTFNTQLGYISLQQRLGNDEILAVAYQYSIGDQVYQVGEFGNDGVEATVVGGNQPSNQTVISQTLILKMLKSSLTNVTNPVWNLMMKNIYQIQGAYQLQQEDFRLNILYKNPSALNYITPVNGTDFPDKDNQNLVPPKPYTVTNTTLLKVLNVDKVNYNNDPQAGGDGFFDFIPGMTVDSQNGRLIFTTKEPFGELLFSKLRTDNPAENYDDVSTYNDNQKKYVNPYMYRVTQAKAIQYPELNKFLLRGKYKSVASDGIPIGAFNVPLGSVRVTAAGRVLVEGVDYSVNYQLGKVQILDPSLQASSTPVEISLENNSVFGQQTRRFFGVNVDHLISENFMVGATFLNMKEKPFTQKSSYGQESVNNSIFGLHGNYSSEVPFFTRLVNKLPNIDTDAPSSVTVSGEVAYLMPNASDGDKFQGESTIYVDDFESSQSSIDLRSPYAWTLSSTPEDNDKSSYNFNGKVEGLDSGFKRAKLSWYSIDPVFYTSKPSGVTNDDLSMNSTRRVYSKELYPLTDIVQGQSLVVNTLDMSYYPKDRGPYNNSSSVSDNPDENFGGIVRSLSSTNFEQSNVEYIQFWVMDPYVGQGGTPKSNMGKIYFNLGEISEDVLKDDRKVYENGFGPDQVLVNPQPAWGNAPASQSLIYAFDNNESNRTNQDIGLDGLPSSQEGTKYTSYATEKDPAGDDYLYYLNTTGSVLDRYKNYNGLEGNSNVNISSPNRGSSTVPDVEDVNRDNTMNTINAYYEYSIDIKPDMDIGQKYISDVRNTVVDLPNGGTTQARWIQFKIPISIPENTIGSIEEYRSIRFMRMFLTNFTDQVTLRFGSLDLVRGEWRQYKNSLDPNDLNVKDDAVVFETASINLEENSNRCPINYISPPSVQREQLYNNNTVINQDEQSLSMRVSGGGLKPLGSLSSSENSRGAFKNFNIDMRQYKNLKMFVHAESLKDEIELNDNQMVAFLRIGADYSTDFYQVEIPLKVTKPAGNCSISADVVWPSENEIDLALSSLTNLKLKYLKIDKSKLPADGIYYPDDVEPKSVDNDGDSKLRLGIKGNPNLGLIRNIMLGLKSNEPHKDIKGEVWFNELRLADMDNKGGIAALLNIDTNFADLATVSFTGNVKNFGFGTIEQGPNERSREDIQQYNVVTNINLGRFLPKKWGVNLPFNYSIGEEIITPEYDPFYEDIKLKQVLDNAETDAERKAKLTQAIDYTKRKSINLIGVRKERSAEKKPMPYDVENFTFSQYYNEVARHDFEIEKNIDQQSRTTLDYAFAFQSKPIEPFQKTKFMKKSSYWKFLSDLNFNYLPSSVTFNTNVIRQNNEQQFRQIEDIGIGFEPLFRRNFGFNYQYGFNFNLTKSLKINYTAASRNLVKNYLNKDDEPIDNVTIWDGYLDTGTANFHMQQFILNYEIPLNKIPVLGFIKANYSYTGDYSWQKSSTALSNVPVGDEFINLGNTVQNAKSSNLNATFNMETLYKYIGIGKGAITSPPKPVAPPKPGEKIVKKDPVKKINQNQFVEGVKGVLTSIKTIQLTFTENQGTVLPGYTPSVGFFGSSKPTLGFVFGSQSDVRYEAAKKGWLTTYQEFNQNYTTVNSQIFKGSANLEIIPDLKIDLLADRSYSENFSEQYDVGKDGRYNPRSPYTYGMFSISTVLIGTSFSTSNETRSSDFDMFRNNRLAVADRLANERYEGESIPRYDVNSLPPEDNAAPIDSPANPNNPYRKTTLANNGYPVGFGKNSQTVLLPAFLAAYTGSSANHVSLDIFRNFPIPNWAIKYNGLMRYEFFKKTFKRFSLQQNYRASYTVNSFRSNFNYTKDPNGQDDSGNFYSPTIMSNVTLVEQFNPLIRVDFELKNSFKLLTQINKDRALSMSFDNNLLTEVHGVEYVVGLGYRIKDVTFSSKLADNPTGVIKSDINIKADLTYRDSQTIVRYLDYDNNQLGGGQNIWTLNTTADYSMSKNLTIIFYYNHSFSKPVISTSFPLTNIRSGFTFRYNFGN